METIPDGGILSAAGFRVGAARCGIKKAEGLLDVALIACDGPTAVAGAFTTNRFAAAPVAWCRERLPADDVRAVIVNSGNANACTGPRGAEDVRTCAALVAELVGCAPGQVCVASTGVIGLPLPVDKLQRGIRDAHAALADTHEAARAAEQAIMTTDTRPKAAAVRLTLGEHRCHVGGMAKGAAMIAPNMATMLAFVTTDAAIAPADLHAFTREAVDGTFNRITVDGDTSTNDTVLVLASGRSGAQVGLDGPRSAEFRDALCAVMQSLAVQIVRDGEGATKLIEVRVTGAADADSALRVARAVGQSQLVKCAAYGGDPNWGRIVCATGYSGAPVEPLRTSVHIGPVCVFRDGMPTGAAADEHMQASEVRVHVALGMGDATATVHTCDLTQKYVELNALYTT